MNHEKVDWLIETARTIAADDTTATAFATAAAALAGEFPERSRTLLGELGQTDEARRSPFYVRQLPVMVRTAFAAGDEQLARRLATGLDPAYPLNVHALSSAHAALLEHEGILDEAQSTYAEAARGWLEFGNVPERAFALLGQGRCLWGLGVEGATHPLMEAGALFEQMGYVPALSETIALLESATAAPAP